MSKTSESEMGFREVVNSIGFENWRESAVAESLLDDPLSTFEHLDGNLFLLVGRSEFSNYYIFIEWDEGLRPWVRKIEQETYLSLTLVTLCKRLPVEEKLALIKLLLDEKSA